MDIIEIDTHRKVFISEDVDRMGMRGCDQWLEMSLEAMDVNLLITILT